eukprot:5148980-Prymnesium_polylepis.2
MRVRGRNIMPARTHRSHVPAARLRMREHTSSEQNGTDNCCLRGRPIDSGEDVECGVASARTAARPPRPPARRRCLWPCAGGAQNERVYHCTSIPRRLSRLPTMLFCYTRRAVLGIFRRRPSREP